MSKSWYWIDIETPNGKLELWSQGAPTEQYKIARQLGYNVSYGREGEKPSKSYPAKAPPFIMVEYK